LSDRTHRKQSNGTLRRGHQEYFNTSSLHPPTVALDLVVTLKDWQEVEAVDRIGLDREFYEILGLQVPHVTIPVRPGRDMARLIEVAAMDQKLKGLGQNSALEFNTKLLNLMEHKE